MSLHFPPASGFGLLDPCTAPPDLSPALQAWRDWLRGRAVDPRVEPAPPAPPGSDLAEALARQPALLDWLFPADGWGQPVISDAPRLDADGVGALLAPLDAQAPDPTAPWRRARPPERTVDARILPVYVRWLALVGLSLDHHGALEPRGTPPHPAWAPEAWRPWQRQGLLRIVRFLQLAGWHGHSTTDPLSLLDGHAGHLARWAAGALGSDPGWRRELQDALAEDPALVAALETALLKPSPAHSRQALTACLQRRRFLPGLDAGGLRDGPPAGPGLIAGGRAEARPGHRLEAEDGRGPSRPVAHWRWILTARREGLPALSVQPLDAQGAGPAPGDWLVGPGGQRVPATRDRPPVHAGEIA